MIDVRLLRSDPEFVKAAMARRAKPALIHDLEQAQHLDSRLRDITNERDALRAQVNGLSKDVATMRRNKDESGAEALMTQSRALGETEKKLASEYDEVSLALREVLLMIPNLPHPEVSDGNGDKDNKVIKGPLQMPAQFADHQRVPHWETGVALGILDNERATKISGSMFTMQRGLGATMARALCQLALDRNADAFEEIRPPSLVLTSTLIATGQLPKFADDAFAIERDDLWCIPTAEVPLTSLHASETLNAEDLPLRYMAHTSCFRREAGSAGRDTRGMLRTHEFDKVEILALTTAQQAPEMLIELTTRVESTIAALGLPYRVLEICTGDLGQSHHRSFDIEVYAPGCDQWLEVSSISWFSDYQARRAEIRCKHAGAKGSEIAHTLNASALAVPRVWAAILENFRQADGSVAIPEVLQPYMRGAKVISNRSQAKS
ncbi:MAG: serine--tRNA ligase [Actinobacteria bacterium]|nr:serine--tRNA ligase [Actinomycetota bacterium]